MLIVTSDGMFVLVVAIKFANCVAFNSTSSSLVVDKCVVVASSGVIAGKAVD